MQLKNMKKYKVGFYKKLQGIFTEEVILSIENKLRNVPNIELFTDLDYKKSYVRNGKVYIEDFNLNNLDVYFWHDTVKPVEWNGDNYFLNVLRALENNCVVVNTGESTRIVNDKYLAHLALAKNNLPVADFALVHLANKDALKNSFNMLGKSVLIKPRFGGWGVGIRKVDSVEELFDTAELLLSFLPTDQQQILLEKYYPNDISKWIAVVVFGDKVLFGYRKKLLGSSKWKIYDPEKKDGKGMYSEYIDPPQELREISLKAKKAIGKDIIGFDFILTEEGYKIVDENGRPGIYSQCIKGADIDIEKEIIDLILSKIDILKLPYAENMGEFRGRAV